MRFHPPTVLSAASLVFAGMLPIAIPPVPVTAACASPHLHPSVVRSRPLPSIIGVHAEIQAVTADPEGDVLWSAQAAPPNTPARLFVYRAVTGAITRLTSSAANSTQRIGHLGISPRWIVFSTAHDQYQGSDWRVIVRDRLTGRERIAATGLPGGFVSGQFALDGDTLVWIQTRATTIEILARTLNSGQTRRLASVPAYNNLYDVIQADRGHVVWEWDHLHGHTPRSDVLLTDEMGGPVRHVTTDGKGSQPSVSWPTVAYVNHYRFANSGNIIVRNLVSGRRWAIGGSGENQQPQVSGSLLVYNPVSTGLLELYDLAAGRGIKFLHVAQLTVMGVYNYHLFLTRGVMASAAVPTAQYAHQPNLHRYVLAIYHYRASDPLDSVLTCNGAG